MHIHNNTKFTCLTSNFTCPVPSASWICPVLFANVSDLCINTGICVLHMTTMQLNHTSCLFTWLKVSKHTYLSNFQKPIFFKTDHIKLMRKPKASINILLCLGCQPTWRLGPDCWQIQLMSMISTENGCLPLTVYMTGKYLTLTSLFLIHVDTYCIVTVQGNGQVPSGK